MTNKKKLIAIIVVVMITISAIGYFVYEGTIIYTDDAQVNSYVYFLSPKIPGIIKDVYVNNFMRVNKGELLIRIDRVDYINQLHSLQHQYNATVYKIKSLNEQILTIKIQSLSKIEILKNQLKANRAILKAYKVNLHKAYLDLIRYKTLYKNNAVSKNQLEIENQTHVDILAKVKAQKKAIESITSQINGTMSYKNQIKEIQENIKVLKSKLQSLKNQINIAVNNLQHTNIRAPHEGIVTHKTVEDGQFVQPGQTLLMIVPLHDAWIDANFKETQIHNIKIGDKAKIHIDAYPHAQFYGTVVGIDAGTGDRFSLLPPQNASGNYIKIVQRVPIRIKLKPYNYNKYRLRVGLNCEVTIIK